MAKVREHQLDDVVSRLVEFDRSQNPEGVAYHYLLCGNRLVPWSRALADPRSLAKFLKKGRWRDRCIKLPFRADSVQVKNNLRVFGYGPKKDQTAKIALAGLFRNGTLAREIRARHWLMRTIKPSFGIAPVMSYDRQGARWLVEKQISEKLKDDSVTEEFVVDHAMGFYRSTVRTREIGQRPVGGSSVADFVAFLPEASRLHFSEKLASLSWPIALGHGDLSKGNMMRDALGSLYLVDWEKAGVRPVAFDLRTLYGSPSCVIASWGFSGPWGSGRQTRHHRRSRWLWRSPRRPATLKERGDSRRSISCMSIACRLSRRTNMCTTGLPGTDSWPRR